LDQIDYCKSIKAQVMEYSIVMCNFIGRQRRKYCAFRWWFNVSL